MNLRILARRYIRALSAIAVPMLLVATLLLAGSAQSAGGRQNADHSDGQMALRASAVRQAHHREESAFSQRAGLPAATVPNSTDGGTAEAQRDTETTDFTEAGHPFSANPFRRRQSAPSRARRGVDHPSAALRSSPVMFIENVGQFPGEARFQVWGGSGTMWLAEDAIWITVLETPPPTPPRHGEGSTAPPSLPGKGAGGLGRRGVNLKLTFPGANPHPRLEPFDRLETKVSYFVGNDPEKWRPDVPVWGALRYKDLYPGIDLEITGEGGHLVQRLIAHSGADLSAVRLRVQGADNVLLKDGRLHLATAVESLTLPGLTVEGSAPRLEPAHIRRISTQSFEVESLFAITDSAMATRHPLMITQNNPHDLLYSTFLGNGRFDDGYAIAVGGSGEAYVTGVTDSPDFPTTVGAFDTTYNNVDAFVAKLDATGSVLDYATFLGGSDGERPFDITVDKNGITHVVGVTGRDFPTTPDAFDTTHNGMGDAFVTKLSASGDALLCSTYLGGSGTDYGFGVATGSSGEIFVVGESWTGDFPTTPGAFDTSYGGLNDGFVTKLDSTCSSLIYSTYLGGSLYDSAHGVVVDENGAAYITGGTSSTDFPTTPGAFDTTGNATTGDAFVSKLNTAGTDLLYSTFLSGSGRDEGWSVAINGNGAVYIAGETLSDDFPVTPNALDTSYNGDSDAFVTKLNASGSGLVYSTFLGGNDAECYWTDLTHWCVVAVDGNGGAVVAGYTRSTNFPTTADAFDTTHQGEVDAFVVKLFPDGTRLTYSTFLGGSSGSLASAVAVEETSTAYVAGHTSSTDFPATPGAFDTSYNGGLIDAFVAKLTVEGEVEPTYPISGRVTDDAGNPIPNTTVRAAGLANAFTTTGADGTYTLSGLPAGTYSVSASKPGYYMNPPGRSVTVPPDATNVNFVVQYQAYSVYGQVTDNAGNPIAEAVVIATGPYNVSTTTSRDGTYTLRNLPAGTYSVSVSKAGYAGPPAQSVTVPPDATSVNFVLPQEFYSVSGQVTDADDSPLPDVTISVDGTPAGTTDSHGNYTIGGLVAGVHTITPSRAGYTFVPDSLTINLPGDATTSHDFVGYVEPPPIDHDLELAIQYAPYLWLHDEDPYDPNPVSVMLNNAALYRDLDFQPVRLDPDILGSVAGDGYHLNLHYAPYNDTGAHKNHYMDRVKESDKVPKAYARVCRNGLYTVIQYWLFYYYNNLSIADLGEYEFVQTHEGDWEMVQVVLWGVPDTDLLAPLYAVYSQHTGGSKRYWSDVITIGGHPLVYVARGSHASYFAPGRYWIDIGLVYIPIPLDVAEPHRFVSLESQDRLELLRWPCNAPPPDAPIPWWLNFPGRWGEAFPLLNTCWLGQCGPPSPPQQGLKWENPFEFTGTVNANALSETDQADSWFDSLPWDELAPHYGTIPRVSLADCQSHVLSLTDTQGRRISFDVNEIDPNGRSAEYIRNCDPGGAGRQTILIHDPDVEVGRIDLLPDVTAASGVGVAGIQQTRPITLEVNLPDYANNLVTQATYSTTFGITATGSISVTVGVSLTLELDNNGDGITDQVVDPTLEETEQDFTAPAAVSNLSVIDVLTGTVTISWSAPGDDGMAGTAAAYDLRYYTEPLTPSNWGSATQVVSPTVPTAAGTSQTMTVSDLPSGDFYFAVRAIDEVGNAGDISNSPAATVIGYPEGDFDRSCLVDVADIQTVAARWRAHVGDAPYDLAYDLNWNAYIDIADIGQVAARWGMVCQAAPETAMSLNFTTLLQGRDNH